MSQTLGVLPRTHRRYLDQVVGVVTGELDTLGCYVHGSAALGGFNQDRSDLDVLVVVRGPVSNESVRRVGRQLLDLDCPARGLELSIVTDKQAQTGGTDTGFVLHVDSADQRAVVGDGRADPDLILHYAVCRQAAIHVGDSLPAAEVIAEVPRQLILDQLSAELTWALDKPAPAEYVVLNACRALCFAETNELVSKVHGGGWAVQQGLDVSTIQVALARQIGGEESTTALERGSVDRFALLVLERLRTARISSQ
jgi:hypothetical protein